MAKSDNQPEDGFSRIEAIALECYQDLLRGPYRMFRPEALAKEAFARAMPFAKVSEQVRAQFATGRAEDLPQRQFGVTTRAPMVTVPRYWFSSDANQFLPEIDPKTKQPVMETVPGDPEAYAPNQGPETPVNQRFIQARRELGWPLPWEEKPYDETSGAGVKEPRAYVQPVH